MTNDLAKGQQNVTDIFYKYRVQLKNYIAKRVFSKEDREDTGTIMGNNESQKKNRKRNKEYI